MRALSIARAAVGSALLWGSAAGAGYAVAWTIRSHHAGNALTAAGRAGLVDAKAYAASTSCRAGTPHPGQLGGLLVVPALSLTAPVEQGETDSVLSAAVGHDVSSVWPGADGTAVLAAHDVSYFARIGSLRPGNTVVYVSPCRTVTFRVTGHRIVPSGSPVADSASPTLVLDTCWPNDALWWTPDRELVTAVETSSRPTRTSLGAVRARTGSRTSPAGRGAAGLAPLAVPAPAGLVAEGLTLDTNPTLLGTMQVTGHPSNAFVQSPEPLDVEQAALTAYYGTLHAVAGGHSDWFAALAPGVAYPAAMTGSSITEYLTRLSVDVEAAGSTVTGALLSAEVTMGSAGGDRTGQLVVACVVRRGELLVTGWHFG